jgi:hypothetical protein
MAMNGTNRRRYHHRAVRAFSALERVFIRPA